jgi:DNA invertase Pin-like site-specific DNA recombinase
MIQDAQKTSRSFDKIIVYDVKRFGRIDNDEAGYYRHILRTNGVQVLYVSENFNGDTTDDLLRPVKQWRARQESKDLSKVTIRGLLSKAQTGFWMGGVPPTDMTCVMKMPMANSFLSFAICPMGLNNCLMKRRLWSVLLLVGNR